MPKQKRYHKTIIHPNRYLMWALAVAFILAFMVVSYAYIIKVSLEADLAAQSNIEYWHTYKDANLTLRYPASWLLDPGANYIGFGPKNSDEFLVYAYSPPNDPAYDSYSKLPSAKQVVVDGLPGIRVVDISNSNQRIAFVKTKTKLYEFRGSTALFDEILQSVHFLKK